MSRLKQSSCKKQVSPKGVNKAYSSDSRNEALCEVSPCIRRYRLQCTLCHALQRDPREGRLSRLPHRGVHRISGVHCHVIDASSSGIVQACFLARISHGLLQSLASHVSLGNEVLLPHWDRVGQGELGKGSLAGPDLMLRARLDDCTPAQLFSITLS